MCVLTQRGSWSSPCRSGQLNKNDGCRRVYSNRVSMHVQQSYQYLDMWRVQMSFIIYRGVFLSFRSFLFFSLFYLLFLFFFVWVLDLKNIKERKSNQIDDSICYYLLWSREVGRCHVSVSCYRTSAWASLLTDVCWLLSKFRHHLLTRRVFGFIDQNFLMFLDSYLQIWISHIPTMSESQSHVSSCSWVECLLSKDDRVCHDLNVKKQSPL